MYRINYPRGRKEPSKDVESDHPMNTYLRKHTDNLYYLHFQVLSLFPALSTSEPKLSWKDEHNEYITFSSDSELHDAIESRPSNKNVIDVYVKVSNLH